MFIRADNGAIRIIKLILMVLAIDIVCFDALLSLIDKQASLVEVINGVMPFTLSSSILIVFLAYLQDRLRKQEWSRTALVFVYLFSLVYMYGYFSQYRGDEQLFDVIKDADQKVLWSGMVVTWLGIAEIIRLFIEMLKRIVVRIGYIEIKEFIFFKKNKYIKLALILFLWWSAFALIRYPAGAEPDAYYQILQFLGYIPMDNHWPYLSTAIMGAFVKLGIYLFGSPNVGAFLLVIVQIILASMTFSYSLYIMSRLNVAKWWRCFSFFVYAFVPIFVGFISSIVKDAMFGIAFVYWITLLIKEIYLEEKCSWQIVVTGILVCLLRKNGYYVVLISLALFAVYQLISRRMTRKRLGLELLIIVLTTVLPLPVQPLHLETEQEVQHPQSTKKVVLKPQKPHQEKFLLHTVVSKTLGGTSINTFKVSTFGVMATWQVVSRLCVMIFLPSMNLPTVVIIMVQGLH